VGLTRLTVFRGALAACSLLAVVIALNLAAGVYPRAHQWNNYSQHCKISINPLLPPVDALRAACGNHIVVAVYQLISTNAQIRWRRWSLGLISRVARNRTYYRMQLPTRYRQSRSAHRRRPRAFCDRNIESHLAVVLVVTLVHSSPFCGLWVHSIYQPATLEHPRYMVWFGPLRPMQWWARLTHVLRPTPIRQITVRSRLKFRYLPRAPSARHAEGIALYRGEADEMPISRPRALR